MGAEEEEFNAINMGPKSALHVTMIHGHNSNFTGDLWWICESWCVRLQFFYKYIYKKNAFYVFHSHHLKLLLLFFLFVLTSFSSFTYVSNIEIIGTIIKLYELTQGAAVEDNPVHN